MSSSTPRISRRDWLGSSSLSLAAVALAGLLNREACSEQPPRQGPLSARPPMFPATARRIIYLHMIGAPSQLDMFDSKPELARRDGERCPDSLLEGRRFAFIGGAMTLAGSRWKFSRHGESGQEISELLPELTSVADELTVIRTLQTDEINHAPAQLFLHSGTGRGGRPGLGSWVTYGLGALGDDLPAYVTLQSGPLGGAGTGMWSSGFLPSVYQGVPFRSTGEPVLFVGSPPGHKSTDRRRILDAVRTLNQLQWEESSDPEITTRIEQYEMAFRMQTSVPELADLSQETAETLRAYGVQRDKPSFAANCLLARRLVERGVRIVELYDADWDHHSGLAQRLPAKCREIDRPIAALLRDLRQRGLLDDTLVLWGSEFGRTPLGQGVDGDGKKTNPGRDHHKDAYTVWLAGGGVKRGISLGKTDELGFSPVDRPVHVHDLNATVLHLLGIDHERLTYRYQGREFRLTDVHGHVIQEII